MADQTPWEIEQPGGVSNEVLGVRQAVQFFLSNALLVLGGVLIGIALGLVLQKITPTAYESKGKFVVDELPFSKQGSDSIDAETERQLVQTLILSIGSRDMAAAVAEHLDIPKERLSFDGIDLPLKLRGDRPEANIQVTATKESRIGVITATSQSAEFAADVVNAILAQLQLYNQIGGRLKQLSFDITLARSKADTILSQIVTVSEKRITLEQQNAELAVYTARGLPLASFAAFSEDPTLNNLKTQLILVQSEYDSIASTSTRGARLSGKRSELDGLEQQITHHARSLASAMRSEFDILTTRERDLQAELAATQKNIQALNDVSARFVQSYGDPAMMRKVLAESGTAGDAAGNVVVVIDRGSVNKKPVRPRLALNLAIGLVFGGMLGFGAAALRTLLDNRLRGPESVESKTGRPCLAALPPLDPIEKRKNIFERPRSPIGLGYLRSHLLRVTMESPGRKIVAISPDRKNGDNSRLVASLAILLAQSGRRTLVIDIARHGKRIASMFAMKEGDGLSRWLSTDGPLKNQIDYTALRELGVLGFGKTDRNLDDLLGRRPLAMELPDLLADWDYILVNSPSIRFDWTLMLTLPEEALLLITSDYRKSRTKDVLATAQRARNSRWHVEGVVLQNCPYRVSGSRSL